MRVWEGATLFQSSCFLIIILIIIAIFILYYNFHAMQSLSPVDILTVELPEMSHCLSNRQFVSQNMDYQRRASHPRDKHR